MQTFDKKKHEYLIDGKRATGITTVIGVLAKPALYSWYARKAVEYIAENASPVDIEGGFDLAVWNALLEEAKTAGNRNKDKAADHGTDAHALVEEWIKNRMDNRMSATDFTPIQPFIEWAIENVDHFLFSERTMFNKDLFIAGTADFGAVMKDGKKLIGDFKTSSGVYGIDYFLQCAGYKLLAESEGDEPYDGCVIVRLGKKGPADFDVTYRYDTETDKEAFLACLTLYRAQATYTRPINNHGETNCEPPRTA
jgi:hypothetical protein